MGIYPGYHAIERTTLLTGRLLNERDVAEARRVAVIGTYVVELLSAPSVDPVGARIDIQSDRGALFVYNSLEEYQKFSALFIGITLFTAVVLVGVSNIMLIAVRVRIREIGVCSDIRSQRKGSRAGRISLAFHARIG